MKDQHRQMEVDMQKRPTFIPDRCINFLLFLLLLLLGISNVDDFIASL